VSRYFGRDGRPMKMLDWARKFDKIDRRVGHNTIGRKVALNK